jgi:hypothetical protein
MTPQSRVFGADLTRLLPPSSRDLRAAGTAAGCRAAR